MRASPGYPEIGLESSFEPVSSRRTFEEAVEQIAERIKSGDLHVGDRLPSERELASIMRISRPTLREAVKTLAPLPEGSVKKALTRFAETIVERQS